MKVNRMLSEADIIIDKCHRSVWDKLMFRVYDFTNATRPFGAKFKSRWQPPKQRESSLPENQLPESTIQVKGFKVGVTDAGRYILTEVDGKALPVPVEEYKERLAARLVEEAPTVDEFRARWIEPPKRRVLLGRLPDGGRSAVLVQRLEAMDAYDLYDVLVESGYGLAPRTRTERAEAFTYKHDAWLKTLPPSAAATLKAMARQFAVAGTEGLENQHIFDLPEVRRASGLGTLKVLGEPARILHETKARMFAV